MFKESYLNVEGNLACSDISFSELLSRVNAECKKRDIHCASLLLTGMSSQCSLKDKKFIYSTSNMTLERAVQSTCKEVGIYSKNVFFSDRFSGDMLRNQIFVSCFSNIIVYKQPVIESIIFLLANYSKSNQEKIATLMGQVGNSLTQDSIYVYTMWFYNRQIFDVEEFLGVDCLEFLSQFFCFQ